MVSAARKSKSETLLTGEARDVEDIPATQENPSTNEAASVSLSAVAGKEEVSVVTTDDLTSQLEPHAANESSAFSRNLKVLQSPVESEGRRMIMTVGRSSRTPSFGQLDGLGREGDEQEKQEGQEQEEKKEKVKEREEEEEKTAEKTDEEGAHEAAYVDQGDQGWIPVACLRIVDVRGIMGRACAKQWGAHVQSNGVRMAMARVNGACAKQMGKH